MTDNDRLEALTLALLLRSGCATDDGMLPLCLLPPCPCVQELVSTLKETMTAQTTGKRDD